MISNKEFEDYGFSVRASNNPKNGYIIRKYSEVGNYWSFFSVLNQSCSGVWSTPEGKELETIGDFIKYSLELEKNSKWPRETYDPEILDSCRETMRIYWFMSKIPLLRRDRGARYVYHNSVTGNPVVEIVIQEMILSDYEHGKPLKVSFNGGHKDNGEGYAVECDLDADKVTGLIMDNIQILGYLAIGDGLDAINSVDAKHEGIGEQKFQAEALKDLGLFTVDKKSALIGKLENILEELKKDMI